MTSAPKSSCQPTTPPTPQLSPEEQKAIAAQVETALYNSDIFQRTTAALEKLPERKRKAIKHAIEVNCRQAIQLACQEIAQQYTLTPANQDSDTSDSDDDPDLDFVPSPYLSQRSPSAQSNVTQNQPWPKISQIADRLLGKNDPPANPPSCSNDSADNLPTTFAGRLRQIGQTLQKARKARSLSLQQLHHQTFIPIYQIQALEAGELDKLPEDIYIRGFISRISKTLGINSDSLLSYLPKSPNNGIPSWHGKVYSQEISVNSPSMYLGYAAVFGTALGSVVWLADNTQASPPTAEPDTETILSPSAKHSPSDATDEVGNNMAPPEWDLGR
jgi:hypothetical protein